MKVFLLLVLALIAQVSFNKFKVKKLFKFLSFKSRGKIVIGKWAIQFDPTFADIKYEVKNEETMSIDSHCLADADDIIVSSWQQCSQDFCGRHSMEGGGNP